jgi:hypothetical protein
VAKEKTKYWLITGLLLFIIYVFLAAQPIPVETILTSRWLTSLESNYPVYLGDADTADPGELIPVQLGTRFGYVGADGRFSINRPLKGYISLSPENWAEYEAAPESIEIFNPQGEPVLTIEKSRAYPLFLDKRIFLISSEQNSLSALDKTGEILWTYDFAAPLTCIDAAAGFVLTGSLDGSVELLDAGGRLAFSPFEPGGSRLSVILGCSISKDGSRIAVISGIDDQRFLLLERFGETYKVIYHEFLTDGFRRAVHVAFIDNDNRVAFEREGGIGIYDINSRTGIKLPLEGKIIAFDENGSGRIFFIITSQSEEEKRLVAVRFPGTVMLEAAFKSKTAFLGRQGPRLYVGGGMTLAAFELDKK